MNTRSYSNPRLAIKVIGFLLVFLAALALTTCSSTPRTEDTCYINIEKRVTINVTDARPREVFDQLSDELNCKITVYPFFMQKITVQMENARLSDVIAAIIPQLHAKYIYDGGHLSIMPLTILERWQVKKRAEFNEAFAEMNRKFETRLPEGMAFENVPMSTVLEEISNASGLELTPMEGEGDRLVTVDVSGMTVQHALEAVVRYIDGEGHVVVKTWNGYAQRGIVDRP